MSISTVFAQRIFTPNFLKRPITNNQSEPTLNIFLNDKIFTIGESIDLLIIFRNTTKNHIGLFDLNPERSFDITIKDEKGIIQPLTKEGSRRRNPDIIMHRESVTFDSGQQLAFDKISLNNFFDLSRRGNYTLEVKRTYYPVSIPKVFYVSPPFVTSNLVKFCVKSKA